MNYSARAQPHKHWMGIAIVMALHVVVIYALVTSLGKKVIDVIRLPIETKIIAEVVKPPAPPPQLLLPPPKMEAPPPPFIPPPEIQIAVPVPVRNTITVSVPTPPPVVAAIHPVAPPTPPAPPARPAPKPVESITTICSTMVKPTMPRRALREGIDGMVKARATIRGGKVSEVEILSSQPRGLFDSAVRAAMLQYECVGNHVADQEFVFKLD